MAAIQNNEQLVFETSLQIRVSLSVEAKNYLLDKTEENSNICVEIQK